MPETYLQTAYKDREKVKALGARWDAERRQWYVPEGRDLTLRRTRLSESHQSGGEGRSEILRAPTQPAPPAERCLRGTGTS